MNADTCQLCGGPHRFDTSVDTQKWNKIIRAKGLPEYLCLSCTVAEFVKARENFTAHLYGPDSFGAILEVQVV